VAAGLTPFDIGGDSRGSIQCPATYCGVFGLRPTEHRVPLTGTIFIDPIRKFRVLATAEPMARSVGDLRLAMQVIAGPDGRDPEVPPVLWRDTAPVELNGLRVGYSPGYPSFVAGEIRAGTDALAAELQELGVIVEDRLPDPALPEHGQVVEGTMADAGIGGRITRTRVGWAGLRSAVELFGGLGPAGPVHGQLGAVLRHP
jgi:amidase